MNLRTGIAALLTVGAVWVGGDIFAQQQGENFATQRSTIATKETVVPTKIQGVPNASKTSTDAVYFGGQPTQESIEALKQQGVKVVINLRRAEEMEKVGFDEKAAVEAAGTKYVQVPMESTALPSAASMKPILELLGTAPDDHVFLHCGSSNRVGGVWAFFEATNGGKSADDAIAEGKKAGLKTPELEKSVRERTGESAEKTN